MARIAIMVITALALGGCLTTGSLREVRTKPAGAYLMIEGFDACETPCTIKLDSPRRARISKTGYVTQDIVIERGILPMTVTLDLAAASTGVDTAELPAIE